MRITKDKLIQGTKLRESVAVPEIGDDATVTVRPLNELESSRYNSIVLEGLPAAVIKAMPKLRKANTFDDAVDAGLSIQDVMRAQENQRKATVYAASRGLSCDGESWSEAEVVDLPGPVIDRIAATAMEISGMTREGVADARRFRGGAGGVGIAGDAQSGLPAGGDDAGTDAGADDSDAIGPASGQKG